MVLLRCFLYVDTDSRVTQVEVLDDFLEFQYFLLLFLDEVLELCIFFPSLVPAVLPLSLVISELFCFLHPIVALPPSIRILVQ